MNYFFLDRRPFRRHLRSSCFRIPLSRLRRARRRRIWWSCRWSWRSNPLRSPSRTLPSIRTSLRPLQRRRPPHRTRQSERSKLWSRQIVRTKSGPRFRQRRRQWRSCRFRSSLRRRQIRRECWSCWTRWRSRGWRGSRWILGSQIRILLKWSYDA